MIILGESNNNKSIVLLEKIAKNEETGKCYEILAGRPLEKTRNGVKPFDINSGNGFYGVSSYKINEGEINVILRGEKIGIELGSPVRNKFMGENVYINERGEFYHKNLDGSTDGLFEIKNAIFMMRFDREAIYIDSGKIIKVNNRYFSLIDIL